MSRILVAGIGNIFFGDDAFGCEVIRALAAREPAPGVMLRDFGIRGLDLAYALLEGYDAAILVDALQRGRTPGTLYVLEPDAARASAAPELDAHGMTPDRVFSTVKALGGTLPPLRIVGCEPAALGSELEPCSELSPAVRAAVPEAVRLVERLIDESRVSHA